MVAFGATTPSPLLIFYNFSSPKVRTCSRAAPSFLQKKESRANLSFQTGQHGFFVFCIVTRSPSRNGKLPVASNLAKCRKG
jgi:hypothetical protein